MSELEMTAVELAALERAVEALPPKSRLALQMLRDGSDYEEIGTELQIDPKLARQLVERAMEFPLERKK